MREVSAPIADYNILDGKLLGSLLLERPTVNLYIYIYVYTYMHIYMHIFRYVII